MIVYIVIKEMEEIKLNQFSQHIDCIVKSIYRYFIFVCESVRVSVCLSIMTLSSPEGMTTTKRPPPVTVQAIRPQDFFLLIQPSHSRPPSWSTASHLTFIYPSNPPLLSLSFHILKQSQINFLIFSLRFAALFFFLFK